MPYGDLDHRVRIAAFRFLEQQVRIHGDDLSWSLLKRGFPFEGRQILLMGPQGIFKPAILPELPLSITTAPAKLDRPRPYDDAFLDDGKLAYRYRGTDPSHPDNRRLRRAMDTGTPLIYFHGVVPGRYVAQWPAYVSADDPSRLTFTVEVEMRPLGAFRGDAEQVLERRYTTILMRQRLHQQTFRARVLAAYREQCAFCRLRHRELLDAAHIAPDSDPAGEPRVPNGLALCKLHHAAFDTDIVGVRPDLVLEVRRDVLEEVDGPMLQHGLQGLHGLRIFAPTAPGRRPDPSLLEARYRRFRATA